MQTCGWAVMATQYKYLSEQVHECSSVGVAEEAVDND